MTEEIESKESILGILRAAISIEKFGIRYYSALSSAVENENGKSLLTYLVDAEEKHQRILEDIYNKQKEIGDSATRPLPLDNLDEDGRLAIFAEPLNEVDPNTVDAAEALSYGIHVEERSKIFYENAAKIVDDIELKEMFSDLVKFEDEHLKLLQKNLDEVNRSGNWRGYVATS